jgi:hypothetical protein
MSTYLHARLGRTSLLALCAAVGLAACSLEGATNGTIGGGGSEPRCDDCTGEDGGAPAPPAVDGQTVAMLAVYNPSEGVDQYVLRGTFPVPPHTFPRGDGKNPFVVTNWDGTPLTTQTEIVSRYAAAGEGADVVEVLALVERDPRLAEGTPLSYEVVHAPHAQPPGPGSADLGDFEVTENVPTAVQTLLADPGALEIASYDCFGNRYSVRPLDGTGSMQIKRYGEVSTEIRIYQTMQPDTIVSGAQGTLPHLLGVHTYLRTYTGDEIVGLELRFSNAHSGRDTGNDDDDPLDKVYFREIELEMPATWTMKQDFPDPFLGGQTTVAGRSTWDLVRPIGNGDMHVICWQAQFHRRLWLATPSFAGKAFSYSESSGQAFCKRGTDPFTGRDLWSWWNRGTARYFTQKYALPTLDHANLGGISTLLFQQAEHIEQRLLDGLSDGDYPIDAAVLGWGHPYGVPYGGMTGGTEIYRWDGVPIAATASRWGYRYYAGVHRMHTERMPNALFDLDGEPSSVERWLIENGNRDYVPFYHFINPYVGGQYSDAFGLLSAPRFQIDYVAANGLQPWYEAEHFEFAPHDYQHFIRYTRSAKVLAWLGNDSLAKDDIRTQAENFHLSYHAYYNDAFGGKHGTGLRASLDYVAAYPGKGVGYGRGEAWGTDCAVAAYALGTPQWRAAKKPWFDQILQLVSEGQGDCSGFILAFISNKAVDGKYRARQAIEHAIADNALHGMRESVFRRQDSTRDQLIVDVILNHAYAFIGDMAWKDGYGPWRYTGIGPLDVNLPIWCTADEMPADAVTANDYEKYLNFSSLAYAYELTGDPVFLSKAREELFTGNLLQALQSEGIENIENRSALLALCQHLEQ